MGGTKKRSGRGGWEENMPERKQRSSAGYYRGSGQGKKVLTMAWISVTSP